LLANSCVERIAARGALPPERVRSTVIAAWSAVHGLSTLLLDGQLAGPLGMTAEAPEPAIQAVVECLVPGRVNTAP